MPETFDRRRILVVDDEERMVRFIRMNLEHDGFLVAEAFNGKQAISKIRDVMEQNVQMGMCTFDQSFLNMYKNGLIDEETAISNADQPGDMRIRIQQVKLGGKEGRQALSGLDTSRLKVSD